MVLFQQGFEKGISFMFAYLEHLGKYLQKLANEMNIVQLIKRVLAYAMSYLAYDARNPICLNGRKPQWIQVFAELLLFW